MRKRKKALRPRREPLDGPAKLTPFHIVRPVAVGPTVRTAWRNQAEHPLTLAFEKGQLARGNARYSAQDRYDAGTEYRRLCEMLAKSGRDSTDLERLGAGYTGVPITQAKSDAIKRLGKIDAGLKTQDARIVRHVCGDAWPPSDAVREACGHAHYAKLAVPRFVEALDNLIEAMESVRKRTNRAVDASEEVRPPTSG